VIIETCQPVTKAKLLIKSLKYIQMQNSIPSSPELEQNSITTVEDIESSHTCTKPLVGCSFSFHQDLLDKIGILDTTPDYLKEIYENKRRHFPIIPW
jgi:hypothetical protein